MPNPIHVPDIPGPRKQLCWRQAPATLARCDRCLGHGGLHTWEWAAILFVSAEKPDGPADVCHVGNGPTSPQNAAGIVALRNAAPALLDEVEALRAVLDTARWPGTQRDDEIVVLVNAAAWQAWRARKEHL